MCYLLCIQYWPTTWSKYQQNISCATNFKMYAALSLFKITTRMRFVSNYGWYIEKYKKKLIINRYIIRIFIRIKHLLINNAWQIDQAAPDKTIRLRLTSVSGCTWRNTCRLTSSPVTRASDHSNALMFIRWAPHYVKNQASLKKMDTLLLNYLPMIVPSKSINPF